MSQTILVTSGEYSEYHVEALLNVPSMDWLRERFIPPDKQAALLDSPWAAVLDRDRLRHLADSHLR